MGLFHGENGGEGFNLDVKEEASRGGGSVSVSVVAFGLFALSESGFCSHPRSACDVVVRCIVSRVCKRMRMLLKLSKLVTLYDSEEPGFTQTPITGLILCYYE